jgi:hypothetical protein
MRSRCPEPVESQYRGREAPSGPGDPETRAPGAAGKNRGYFRSVSLTVFVADFPLLASKVTRSRTDIEPFEASLA